MSAPLPPEDPNVRVPARVKAAGAAAEAIHKEAYRKPVEPQPDPTLSPAPANDPAPSPAPQPAPPQAQQPEPSLQPAPRAPQPDPQPAPQPQPAPPTEDLTAEQWRHRFLSMQGRYNQAATSLGSIQEQLSEMGNELMLSQQEIERMRAGGVRPHTPGAAPVPAPEQFLTPEEMQSYGPEFIGLVQRAARAAIIPDMQNLQSGVQRSMQQVSQRVQKVTVGNIHQQLDQAVPEWRQINIDPRFKAWCGLPDVYSGQVRGKLLQAAFQGADAPRVIAFFQGFLNEERATGQLPDPSVQPAAMPPRVPATSLELLAAPGRAKPAGGDTNPSNQPADKPIFTRAQIAEFYRAVREGHYNGREADKAALEQAIFVAQREGRVR